MSQPPQDAIDQCTLLTGCTRQEAIEFLKRYDNDANRAINAFFDNPDALKGVAEAAIIDDGLNYERQTSGLSPPARPPSRLQDKGVLNHDQLANINNYLESAELPAQETGTIHADGRTTSQRQYDERSWGVTLYNSPDAQPDADPERRRRQQGCPAFLRDSPEARYLPAFLTVLHGVPAVRERLLLRSRVLEDYGFDAQWWNGRPITLPDEAAMDASSRQQSSLLTEVQRLVAFLNGTERAFGCADHLADIVSTPSSSPEESPDCFMALWQEAELEVLRRVGRDDARERDEPSADERDGNAGEDEDQGAAARANAEPASTPPKLFETFCMKVVRDENGTEISGSGEPVRLVETYCYPDRQESLYDAIDEAIWTDSRDAAAAMDDVWLEAVAPVLPIKISNVLPDYDGVRIKIPHSFYVDRYLAKNKEWARELRRMRAGVARERAALDEKIAKLCGASSANADAVGSGLVATEVIFARAKKAAALLLEDSWTTGLLKGTDDEDERKEQARRAHEQVRQLTATLDAVLPQIEAQLEDLRTRKAALLASLREKAREFTEDGDGDDATRGQHRYRLAGFCTAPHTIYLHRPAQEDSETTPHDTEGQGDSAGHSSRSSSTTFEDPVSGARRQWWRISYSVADWHAQEGAPSRATVSGRTQFAGYTAKRVSVEEVEDAVSRESRSVFLVYVDEGALAPGAREVMRSSHGPEAQEGDVGDVNAMDLDKDTDSDTCSLPAPLQQFVNLDNAAFEQECVHFENSLLRDRDRDRDYENAEPYTELIEIHGQEVPIDTPRGKGSPPPVPPRPAPLPAAAQGSRRRSPSLASDSSQTIKIEVETEEGKWDMMRFPAPSAEPESESGPRQEQEQEQRRGQEGEVGDVGQAKSQGADHDAKPETQHMEDVTMSETDEPPRGG